MSLTIINDSPGRGAYIGGWNIAPDGFLVLADSFDSGWEALTEHMAENGSLPACHDCPAAYDPALDICEGCDFIDMHGPACTLDVVMRVVRPARGD